MKFVVLILVASKQFSVYTTDISFSTASECVQFTMYMNSRMKAGPPFAYMCMEKKP